MKLFAGIDPGQTGAIAFIDGMKRIISVCDWLDVPVMAGILMGDEEYHGIYLNREDTIAFAVLERVASMPGQGVASTFKFGVNFGAWQGILAAKKIPYRLISPQTWQKGILVPSDNADKKKRSLAVCRRLYPRSSWFRREKDHNRADAVLMALHALHLSKRNGI